MKKEIIEVPEEVRYISEWTDFPLQQLSTGHCIVNKTITGCGYTHFCLTNNVPTILCSPRKFLLENKYEQLGDSVHLVVNSGERILDTDGDGLKVKMKESVNIENISDIQSRLRTYVISCLVTKRIPKILVTYDSLRHVLEVLGETISNYQVIVDEFQNIFIDSSFKANTELNFLSYLQYCPNVTYLSATPYIEEYLDELDEFKDLPYYELKWHPGRLQMINIEPKKSYHISRDIDSIVKDYLEGRYPEKVIEDGTIYQSKEVVFYVNSVKAITSIVSRNNLTPENTNIICADTEKNKESLRKIGFKIGKAPLRGEPHKTFTFCTRTTYAGADFYSTSALSVIISDCSIDSLTTDIRMDFPQIMGRQRLQENVFRNECIFIYKLADIDVTVEEFEKICAAKLEMSKGDLKNYESITKDASNDIGLKIILKDIRDRVINHKYKDDYTGVDEVEGKPAINKLVLISEKRAFELRSSVYKNEIQVYNEFAKITEDLSFEDYLEKTEELDRLRTIYKNKGSFESKMREICECLLNPKWSGRIHISDFYWLPRNYRNYLNYLGPGKIKTLLYFEASLKKEMNKLRSPETGKRELIYNAFLEEFSLKERYFLKDIKATVKIIYERLGIEKAAKASDILEFFEVREVSYLDRETKKKTRGYEIIAIKPFKD